MRALQATKTLRCVFTVSATVNMDGDIPRTGSGRDDMELVFDQIDPSEGTARLIGNAGAEDVTVIAGSQQITFVEQTATGTIQLTVVYMARTTHRRFKAVHSRHTAIPGGIPIASQMYGSCQALI